jgi:hypothetical protein
MNSLWPVLAVVSLPMIRELLLLFATLATIVAALAWLARRLRRRSIARLLEGPVTKGAVVITSEVADARVLYLVATVKGVDADRIAGAFRGAPDTFVWCSQTPLDPARNLLWDVVRPLEQSWEGTITDEVRTTVAEGLAARGVDLIDIEVALEVPYDHRARARQAWWVCFVKYSPRESSATFHCDGLEWWLDAASGAGLWSLSSEERMWTSVEASQRDGFRLGVCPAGAPARRRQLALDELGQPSDEGQSWRPSDDVVDVSEVFRGGLVSSARRPSTPGSSRRCAAGRSA